jgi:hypothetical protein
MKIKIIKESNGAFDAAMNNSNNHHGLLVINTSSIKEPMGKLQKKRPKS